MSAGAEAGAGAGAEQGSGAGAGAQEHGRRAFMEQAARPIAFFLLPFSRSVVLFLPLLSFSLYLFSVVLFSCFALL